MARGLVTDATVAQSEAQRQALWAIRELMPESQKFEGGSIKHDVSVPVSRIPQFIVEATRAVENYMPQARVMSFGHMGDGNLHFNVSQPLGMDKKKYLDLWNEMNAVVFDVVLKFDGSISAEHGIGRLKKHHMPEIKSPVELQMMRDLKKLFDPTQHHESRQGAAVTLAFREVQDVNLESVVSLWKTCELTRPWNDPYKDIQFARDERNIDGSGWFF